MTVKVIPGDAVHPDVLLVERGGPQRVHLKGVDGVGDLDLHLVVPGLVILDQDGAAALAALADIEVIQLLVHFLLDQHLRFNLDGRMLLVQLVRYKLRRYLDVSVLVLFLVHPPYGLEPR